MIHSLPLMHSIKTSLQMPISKEEPAFFTCKPGNLLNQHKEQRNIQTSGDEDTSIASFPVIVKKLRAIR